MNYKMFFPLAMRIAKRLAVLGAGALAIYIAFWRIFPFFDNRAPIAIALLATYIVMAYVAIPALFRAIRFFYQPVHIPHYCTTPDGFASDPVNIGLVGTRRQVVHAMEAAGWHMADSHTPLTIIKVIINIILRRPYLNAPMSRLYLFGRKQDLGFEKQISSARGQRHHVRFWATDVNAAERYEHHKKFWQRFYPPEYRTVNKHLWVGAASKDVGFAPIRHNAQLTHMIDPDTNSERELIVTDLEMAKAVAGKRKVKTGRPYVVQNRTVNGYLQSDGRMTICELK